MFTTYSTVSSLAQGISIPRGYVDGSRKGILMFSGLNGTRFYWGTDSAGGPPTGAAFTGVLADDFKFPTATLDMGATWGNSTFRTNCAQLKTNAQAATFGSGKVHLLGLSMGVLGALNFAKYNPTLVQSVCGVLPAVDPQDIYDNDRGGIGLAASISAAYGGRPADADTPARSTSSFSSIPIRLYYSETDPWCIASAVTTFAAAVGSSCTAISMGSPAGGHIYGSNFAASEVGKFFSLND